MHWEELLLYEEILPHFILWCTLPGFGITSHKCHSLSVGWDAAQQLPEACKQRPLPGDPSHTAPDQEASVDSGVKQSPEPESTKWRICPSELSFDLFTSHLHVVCSFKGLENPSQLVFWSEYELQSGARSALRCLSRVQPVSLHAFRTLPGLWEPHDLPFPSLSLLSRSAFSNS